VLGTREGLRPIVDRYGVYARRIQFSSDRRPEKTISKLAEGTYYYPLMMSFDRQGLARAAGLALSEPPRLEVDSKSHLESSKSTIDVTPPATMIPR